MSALTRAINSWNRGLAERLPARIVAHRVVIAPPRVNGLSHPIDRQLLVAGEHRILREHGKIRAQVQPALGLPLTIDPLEFTQYPVRAIGRTGVQICQASA